MSGREKGRYARIPGDAWRSEPFSRLSLEAYGLAMRAWSFFADQATDGHLPRHELASVAKGPVRKTVLAELIKAGVWTETEDGWRCEYYLAANISRDEWARKKELGASRQREYEAREREKLTRRFDLPPAMPDASSDGHLTRQNRQPDASGDALPTRKPQTPGLQDSKTPGLAKSESDARAPAVVVPIGAEALRDAVLSGFGRRWEEALDEGPWPPSARRELVDLVLTAVAERERPKSAIERGLDAYFADCASRKKRPEFGYDLCRDFGMWIGASSLPVDGASKAERKGLVNKLLARNGDAR